MKTPDILKQSPQSWLFTLICGALFVLPMGTSPFTIFGILSIALWIFTGEFYRQRWPLKSTWMWPVLAIIAMTWIGMIYTPDPHGLGIKFAKKSYYWLYAFILAGMQISGKRRDVLIGCLLAGLFVNAMIGAMQLMELVPVPYKGRYTGLSSGYNTLALLLNLGIIVCSFYFRFSKGPKKKSVYFFLLVTYFFHLIILEGRGGYLVFGLLSPLVAYNLTRGRHLLITFLLFLLALDLMSSSPIVQNKVIRTIEDIRVQFKAGDEISWGKHYSEDDRRQRIDRIYMWRWAIELFGKHFLTGVGTGGYKKAIVRGGGEIGINHPHNNFLHLAVSFGIWGVLALAWYFWLLLKNGWTNRFNPIGFFILSSGLVLFTGGMTDTPILDAGSAFLMAVTTGLQASLPKLREDTPITD